jgi:adenylate kinase family enzyme
MNRYICYLLIGSPGAGKGTEGNILGAIPRLRQAQLVEGLSEVRHAFHLFCRDREKVIQRLGNRALDDNRLDDANDTVIRRRLETYESETTPVLEFYRDKLTTIDATQAPLKVINEVKERHFESGEGRRARQRSRMYLPKTCGKSGAFMSNI